MLAGQPYIAVVSVQGVKTDVQTFVGAALVDPGFHNRRNRKTQPSSCERCYDSCRDGSIRARILDVEDEETVERSLSRKTHFEKS